MSMPLLPLAPNLRTMSPRTGQAKVPFDAVAAGFSDADFSATDFSAAGFSATGFSEADFSATDFSEADFSATDFSAAGFCAIDFSGVGRSGGCAIFDPAAVELAIVDGAPGGATRNTWPTFTCLLSGSVFHLARSAGFCLKLREMP
ncbi:pentapeptide repeat-containing protein [Caballeronia glebae]|uniref:pentapeptide repeat-containing protein n=1 Tax=Caballeronia glebae TaxID=1777143 RepID=UPI000B35C88E